MTAACGCWPIPDSAASGRAAGAARRCRRSREGICRSSLSRQRRSCRRRDGRRPAGGCCRCFIRAANDAVDWQRGNYALTTRGGRVESDAGWGDTKKPTRMIAEGSVLVASAEPRGAATDVAPEDFRIRCIAPDSRWRFRFRSMLRSVRGGRVMKYRVTCLTPTLVGDGQKLAPIDYMVWKDHVNVLDQRRIFQAAGQGSAPGRVSGAVEEGRQAGFRVLGRIRAEFRRTAHSVRTSERDSVLGARARRESVHPDICGFARRSVSAGDRDQRRAAHRRGVRSLDRGDHARLRRARWRRTVLPRNPAAKAEDAVLGGPGQNR